MANTATPVAIIGMGCRLPGDINSPEQLWNALLAGHDLVTEIPPERWDADEYYDPEPGVPGRSVSRWGAFLADVGGFDSEFFGMAEREAIAVDPQHRLLLETSWEAIEHAGMNPAALAGSATGVFMGQTQNDYALLAADAHALEGPYGFTGTNYSMASGRVSYALGLHGPAMTVDTACSSSLMAVHLACRSLNDGDSDLALAGGVSVIMEPRKSASASAEGMLSPTGRCHVFDVAADGFVVSEGCAVVFLKRLPDALRDHDRILAVVHGTAANQDGRTVNIATPSLNAQAAVYRAALASAGVDAATVGMVEAHGTGTPVGDPIEYASLAQVYGIDGACALGSVKSNLGHGQSASGAMGLMKAVLALQHGVVPRNLHFTGLPDDLARIPTKLFVPQANTPWPIGGDHQRRAAVSSYGLSGTNVHALLEQAPAEAAEHEVAAPRPAPLMFPFSSTSAEGLRRTAGRLADWVATCDWEDGTALADLAYTLTRRRGHRPVRAAAIASEPMELVSELREIARGETPHQAAVGQDDRGPVWLFSGQGSQWAAMGAELLATEPAFAASVAEMEPLIAAESGFSITEAMSSPQTVTGIEHVQPTLFAMQVALADTMLSYGVRPGAVIGHSLGEVAAAVVAGALSLHDGARVICRRSRLMSRISGAGAMASVDLPAPQVLSELAARGVTDVVLSVVASPQSAVVGGATQTVRELVAAWEERDVMAREVAVDVASHSPQVEPILADLADTLADLHPMTPNIPYYSATQYDPRGKTVCDAAYWVDNLRHMVRFAAAVGAALEDGYRVFAELTPHPLLTHAVEQTARSFDMPVVALTSMRREQPLPHGMRDFLADLHGAGAKVDFSVLNPRGRLVDAPLPAWTHRQLLLTRDSQDSQTHGAQTVSVHPLLGSHVRLHESPERHAWQSDVGTTALPWLGDHRIHDVSALPGAAYCEMALAAARTVVGETSEVRDVRFEQMLLLDGETRLGAVASVDAPDVATFAVETDDDGERVRRASAVLHAADGDDQPPARDVGALLAEHPGRVEGAELRQLFDACGIQFGPAFTGLAVVHTAEGSALAEIGLPGAIRSQHAAYHVHPALLDACFQSVAAHPAVQNASNGGLLLPTAVARLRCHGQVRNAHYCYTRITSAEGTEIEADIDVLDAHGAILLTVQGLRMGTGVSEDRRSERRLGDRLLTVEWRHRELPAVEGGDAGTWLVISTSDEADQLPNPLADSLKASGAQCSTMNWPTSADHRAKAELLGDLLGTEATTGVVVVTSPGSANEAGQWPLRGRQCVSHVVRIARALSEAQGPPPRLHVITRHAQSVVFGDVANLEQGGLRGLLRVIGAEHPHLRTTQIDVDTATAPARITEQLLASSDEDESGWRNGEWYVARLCQSPLRPEERRHAVVDPGDDGMRMEIRVPGDVQTMELVAFERVPPAPGQIEVRVTAAGINFMDVLVAFGQYPSFDGRPPRFGTDFAGVVTAVGPAVTDHRVGDRVSGISRDGCWSNFITCDADLAAALPPEVPDDRAAAVPTAYATAWYGLHDLARISSDDNVLIHSATGGVGQAGLAIARAAGAKIFATAGSPWRRDLLRESGIEHVYDSRSIEFAELIRRDTDGYGVDIVLNSLPGAAQRAGLELLSFDGRFIEIGKRDIYGDTRLGLFPFRRNLAFHSVDLALLAHTRKRKVRDLLRRVSELTADGTLPLPSTTVYPLADAATAIRVMGAAEHTGKLVLDVPAGGRSSVIVPPEKARIFRSDGAYLITGGLGGLGLFLAARMAAAGCGRIVLTSRTQPDAAAELALERIRSTGTDVHVECGDIADPSAADRVVAAAIATGLSLRGVLHAAAVVEDATLANITDDLIHRDWAPKVDGAWNLHCATAGQPIDWFCMFSSAAALVGSPGQGAYAAANSWLDAFTQWRRAQGLPATAIAWGAWADIGRATALAEAGPDSAISPDEGAYAFEALLRHDRAYTGYAPIIGTPWLTALSRRSPFAEVFGSLGQTRTEASEFRAELNALPPDEWPSRLRRLVSDQISVILRRTIDPDRPLTEYGLDSLGNLELRTRIETETGVRVATTDITTVRGLAEHLCDGMAASQAAATPS